MLDLLKTSRVVQPATFCRKNRVQPPQQQHPTSILLFVGVVFFLCGERRRRVFFLPLGLPTHPSGAGDTCTTSWNASCATAVPPKPSGVRGWNGRLPGAWSICACLGRVGRGDPSLSAQHSDSGRADGRWVVGIYAIVTGNRSMFLHCSYIVRTFDHILSRNNSLSIRFPCRIVIGHRLIRVLDT